MAREEASKETADTEVDTQDNEKRGRSTVDFPYTDLESSIEVAQAIHNHAGLGDCTTDQIAAKMQPPTTETSGTFRVKVSSAKVFGLIEGGRGTFKLTDRGSAIIDPASSSTARAEAFLSVELYRKVFELFKGKMLPPTAALKKQLEDLGVSEKQCDRARQVLERSAKQAGFSGIAGRLIAPATIPLTTSSTPKTEEKQRPAESSKSESEQLPPFIRGLLDKLPAQDSEWPVEDRVQWLRATVHIFALMYKGEGKIEIEVKGG